MNSSIHKLDTVYARRLYAVASGLLMILATPPIPLGFLAWFALVPFFKSVEASRSAREVFSLGFLFAIVWHAGTMYWIAWNSGTVPILSIFSAIGLATVLSLWFGFVATLHRAVLKTWGHWAHFLAVGLYMASDVVWQSGDWAFPWITFSLTQASYLDLIQMASIGGSLLVTGFIALLNAILTVGGARKFSLIVTLVLIAGAWVWGTQRERRVHQQTHGTHLLNAAIVQGNIDPVWKYPLGYEYSMNMYDALSSAGVADSVDLMVWPENAAPVYLEQDYRWRRFTQAMVDRIGATLITGSRFAEFHDDKTHTPYNAAFIVRPGGRQQFDLYCKVYLVPFGERIPFQWAFPFLGQMDFGQAEFKPGKEIVAWPMTVANDTIPVSPLICYEAIFPEASERAVHLGADLLVNMTNDGWFTGTGQQVQHLLLSRMRSVETGRSLVRSTNTGISAFITPSGRIGQTIGADQRGVIVHTVEQPVNTFFNSTGWMLRPGSLWYAAVLLLVTAAIAGIRKLSKG